MPDAGCAHNRGSGPDSEEEEEGEFAPAEVGPPAALLPPALSPAPPASGVLPGPQQLGLLALRPSPAPFPLRPDRLSSSCDHRCLCHVEGPCPSRDQGSSPRSGPRRMLELV